MFDFDAVPLPDYTRLEDTLNSVTHAVGVPLTMVFAFLLLRKVNYAPTVIQAVSLLIYSVAMVVLYFGSAYYHGLKPSHLKKVARVLDHSNIFIMIAGSLTGFFLIAVHDFWPVASIVATVIVWVVAVLGILFTFMDQDKFKKIQMVMYIVLGWSALVASYPLVKQGGDKGREFFRMIIIGGVLYMIGAALYSVGKKKRYFHTVFHVFILAGTCTQFVGIYNYI